MNNLVTPPTIYGRWHDQPAKQFADPNLTYNEMRLDAAQLMAHWRRCSLSSDFWSRYTALFVPKTTEDGWLNQSALESVLAYLLNELFENSAKFSSGSLLAVHFQSWIHKTAMVFQVTNHIEPAGQAPFEQIIKELLENDPDELYFQKLEENFENDTDGSGLGFLTLMKDYGVQFGFRFQPLDANIVQVDVQAHLSMKDSEF